MYNISVPFNDVLYDIIILVTDTTVQNSQQVTSTTTQS